MLYVKDGKKVLANFSNSRNNEGRPVPRLGNDGTQAALLYRPKGAYRCLKNTFPLHRQL